MTPRSTNGATWSRTSSRRSRSSAASPLATTKPTPATPPPSISSPPSSPSNECLQTLAFRRGQHRLDMAGHAHAAPQAADDALLVDQHRRPVDAHVLPAIHRLLDPGAVALDRVVVLGRGQGEGQAVFRRE